MIKTKLSNISFFVAGEGKPLILLHGLFGNLANFEHTIAYFSKKYKVYLPHLPLYSLDILKTSVNGMVNYLQEFVEQENLNDFVLVGNSLGGHVALVYTLAHQEKVRAIVLTGSSGLFEKAFGDSLPRRNDYNYIKEKTESTFYDPKHATPELVDEIFSIVKNRETAIRVVILAKSAVRHNLSDELTKIKIPCQLIWGKQDNITPPFVAEEFKKFIPHSKLDWIEECGHAPMLEQPIFFNQHLEQFLSSL